MAKKFVKPTPSESEQFREQYFVKALLMCYLIDDVHRMEQEFVSQSIEFFAPTEWEAEELMSEDESDG